ncbi:MAG: hypothetical protein IPF79_04710 [Ignavibacteria bacterium]|nr:hypothetical protein [Ignavibacteria bacterium]
MEESPLEAVSVAVQYTGVRYLEFNRLLRTSTKGVTEGSTTWKQQVEPREAMVKLFDEFFAKAPKYKSKKELFRSVTMQEDKYKKLLKAISKNETGEWWGVVSTAKDRMTADSFSEHEPSSLAYRVTYVIKKHSGKGVDLSLISANPLEDEVIFNHGIRFRYADVEVLPNQSLVVTIELL